MVPISSSLVKLPSEPKGKVRSRVREYQVLSNGNIVYLANWDDEDRKGDLYLFTGKETLRVDEGVARLLYAYDYWNVVDDVLV